VSWAMAKELALQLRLTVWIFRPSKIFYFLLSRNRQPQSRCHWGVSLKATAARLARSWQLFHKLTSVQLLDTPTVHVTTCLSGGHVSEEWRWPASHGGIGR
jgi:hypothetical protein